MVVLGQRLRGEVDGGAVMSRWGNYSWRPRKCTSRTSAHDKKYSNRPKRQFNNARRSETVNDATLYFQAHGISLDSRIIVFSW